MTITQRDAMTDEIRMEIAGDEALARYEHIMEAIGPLLDDVYAGKASERREARQTLAGRIERALYMAVETTLLEGPSIGAAQGDHAHHRGIEAGIAALKQDEMP